MFNSLSFEVVGGISTAHSPNAKAGKSGWAKGRASQLHRNQGLRACQEAIQNKFEMAPADFKLHPALLPAQVIFTRVMVNPRSQAMDNDNFTASLKPLRDGVAQALGIPDSAKGMLVDYQQFRLPKDKDEPVHPVLVAALNYEATQDYILVQIDWPSFDDEGIATEENEG